MNKYKKWYSKIISRAKKRDQSIIGEFHHIIPKFEGGNDMKVNIVKLTFKEHYVCHLLLTKFSKNKKSASYAYFCMNKGNNSQHKRFNSKLFSLFKESHSDNIKGENNSFFGKKHTEKTKELLSKINKERAESEDYINPFLGQKHSKKTKRNLSKVHKERVESDNYINPFQGRNHTEETKEKMSKIKKSQIETGEFIPSFTGRKVTKEMVGKARITREINGTTGRDGSNPGAKRAIYKNKEYDCLKILMKENNISRYFCKMMISENIIEVL